MKKQNVELSKMVKESNLQSMNSMESPRNDTCSNKEGLFDTTNTLNTSDVVTKTEGETIKSDEEQYNETYKNKENQDAEHKKYDDFITNENENDSDSNDDDSMYENTKGGNTKKGDDEYETGECCGCNKTAKGKIDETDGLFYCLECWKSYEYEHGK